MRLLATIVLFIAFLLIVISTIISLIKFQKNIRENNYDKQVIHHERKNYFKKFIIKIILFMLLFLLLGILNTFLK